MSEDTGLADSGPVNVDDSRIRSVLEEIQIAAEETRHTSTSLLYYAAMRRGELLGNRRVEVVEANWLADGDTPASRGAHSGSHSALTIINSPHRQVPHCIWTPSSDAIGRTARRFFICHEIGHLLFDDDASLTFSEDETYTQDDEEETTANLFAMLAAFGRGQVQQRKGLGTEDVIRLNPYLSQSFDHDTVLRAYHIVQDSDLAP